LTHIFAKHSGLPVVEDVPLEALLIQSYADARKAWPQVALPVESYVAHVAGRVPRDRPGAPVAKVLGAMALSDLYLACACTSGVPGAHAALEAAYFASMPGLLRKQFREAPAATVEDACQLVRQKLLLATPDAGPHLLTYAGEGGLLAWIRVIAVRQLIKLLPASGASPDLEQKVAPEPSTEKDGEKGHIRQELHDRLRQVICEAAAVVLTERDRTLLDDYYRKQMSQKELAEKNHTSQAGISRRLALLRETLREEIIKGMRARHGIRGAELHQLVADQSRLDVTMSRVLGSNPGSASPLA
jgi:RNA polymerase sigma-70 factor (ECF subfamily)